MSSSVMPLYVRSSFHTGFRVFLCVFVFSLLACGVGTKDSQYMFPRPTEAESGGGWG